MATIIHLDSCPLCGARTGIYRLLQAVDHTVSHEPFEIWQCGTCQVRFTQDPPGPGAIGSYYQSDRYISHSDTRDGLINRLYHLVRKRTLQTKLGWVIKGTGLATGQILDFGCGTGAFLNRMRQAGWSVMGLEPDPGARAKAAQTYHLTIMEDSTLATLPSGSFDAITLWHVLEHVHDLHGTLRQLVRLLRPRGTLFVAVPNYVSLDARIYGRNWAAYDPPRHLYHFSPEAMKSLAAFHGLFILETHSMAFDSFYVSLLSEKYLGKSFAFLRGGWTGFKSWLASRFNPQAGSSLVYVLKPDSSHRS